MTIEEAGGFGRWWSSFKQKVDAFSFCGEEMYGEGTHHIPQRNRNGPKLCRDERYDRSEHLSSHVFEFFYNAICQVKFFKNFFANLNHN